ncbi:hypothetical protein [Marinomonas mediterranea]|jgi:hypothetical protein|uniref:Tetratricopeptide repeat protein n=1 Tax=Marinomonas mediterranea (strain ATCC 700492 / JCM 21426 / NBRC 103028 / MMB-1) TaxID=717774 RepID=F2K2Y6_MARM1|nr:hypothetical protein [Marinomonas mediterranea]ADZ92375.1 hypothetical protein Marme_3157 [Marinomonas mediterranea MMB-1]WCN10327.1 tetratricopeptide repeat protein [Marinomonas mediterranea]WCN14372.1 tetratricopeptide repeat protein [Marinomonas mediterranea]WCN18424.1 tetratricopeptide repeat protein [Marinomonas mediterranea MMB-1]
MQHWERLTRKANIAFTNQAYLESVDLNLSALATAQKEFDLQFGVDAESAVAANIVSYLNLAESYAAMGDLLTANSHYESAINFLSSIVIRPSINQEQTDLIHRTVNHVRFEWDLFSQSNRSELSMQLSKKSIEKKVSISRVSAQVIH